MELKSLFFQMGVEIHPPLVLKGLEGPMSILRPKIRDIITLNGGNQKYYIFDNFLLSKPLQSKFSMHIPLVYAGPHFHGHTNFFMLILEKEVSLLP